MKYSELLERFYQMEVKEKLFEVQDDKGIYVWDLVRYYVFTNLLWTEDQAKGIQSTSSINSFFDKFITFLSNVRVVLSVRNKYFFFINSRNRQPDTGLYFDQNALDTISLFNPKDCLLNEVYPTGGNDVYKSVDKFFSSGLLYRFFDRNLSNYDFIGIKKTIDKYFDQNKISLDCLNQEYRTFQIERKYYRFILRMTTPKLLFVTQAGIRKGLFAAAKELNIPSIEFNHGIVYDGHMAYSYPRIANIRNYNSDYIFALSDFWYKDMFLPNTKVISIGNNYFLPKCTPNNSPSINNSILVISSNEMGLLLKDYIIKIFNKYPNTQKYEFTFKLHPNQFNQKNSYQKYFSMYPNVKVLTNEKSVPQCMQDCASMLAIQSTAAFEALQMGRKVILLKQLSYETMQVIFNDKNVYLVETEDDFIEAVNYPVKESENIFFTAYDSKKAETTIKKIEYGRKKAAIIG